MSTPVLSLRSVSKVFTSTGTRFMRRNNVNVIAAALQEVDFDVHEGEIVGLVGESGSGKTTMARLMNRLIKPSSGSVEAWGHDIAGYRHSHLSAYRKRVQMIFQNADSALHPFMSLRETLAEAIRLAGSSRSVAELLEAVGLPAKVADQYPSELSGGQKRRIGVARVLAMNPEVILADEPLAGLDTIVGFRILRLIQDLVREQNMSMVYITHDLEVAKEICDRVYVLYQGRVVDCGPSSILHVSDVGHPYVAELIENTVGIKEGFRSGRRSDSSDPQEATPPEGEVVKDITLLSESCPWLPRCSLYRKAGQPDICKSNRPKLLETHGGRKVACHLTAGRESDEASMVV